MWPRYAVSTQRLRLQHKALSNTGPAKDWPVREYTTLAEVEADSPALRRALAEVRSLI